MPSVEVLDFDNKKVSTINLSPEVFDAPLREDILHSVVNWQLARRRSGTASTKTRGEVRGGGSKPWRQKGTGRARHGTTRSPLWRGGAIIFGPKPKDWSHNIPKKMRKFALKSALSQKLRDNKIFVVDNFELEEIKTKKIKDLLGSIGINKALLVDKENEKLYKSSRNIKNVKFIKDDGLNVYDILKYDNLVISSESLMKIQEGFIS